MSTKPRITTNVKSRLLSDQENEAIFRIIGRRCLTSCTTLAELSQAEDEKKLTWKTVCSGVVCFVKDNVKRSYFIRFYGGEDKTMVWEHDIHRDRSFVFKTDSRGFLTVTVKDFKLTFTDKEEAEIFKSGIKENLTRARERARAKAKARVGTLPAPPPPPPTRVQDISTQNIKESKSKKKKEKLTKENISNPTNLRHIGHVRTDHGIDVNLDPEMQALFKQIGFNDQSEIDKETLDFIYDFIDNHGGLKKDQQLRPPPPPSRTANRQPPPLGKFNIPPPPPPNRASNPLPQHPGKVYVPPPPPPNRNANPLPQPPGKVNVPPPPPPNRNANPLPQPPGKVNVPPPPPPDRNANPLPQPPGKVYVPPPPPPNRNANPLPPPPAPSTGSPRSPQQTSVSVSQEEGSKDLQLKQQLMELLLQNPSEITDLLYNIIDKRGGLQEIKDNLAGRECQSDPVPEHDDQVPGKTVSDQTVEGATCLTSNDQVPGRMATDTVSGGNALWTSDDELGSDMIDDDDDEWDD